MSTNLVKYPFWTDFDRSSINQFQLLVSDYAAGVLTNAIAVAITSTSGPLFNLAIGPLNWLSIKLSSIRNNVAFSVDHNHEFVEMGVEIVLEGRYRGFINVPMNPNAPTAPNGPRGAAEVLRVLIIALIGFGAPLALLVASILSAGLATDTIALANSPACGRYIYSLNTSTSSGPFLEYEHRAEAQSALYASDCYGSSPLVDSCNKFYNQSISYVTENSSCPFRGSACSISGSGSVQLKTGLLSSSLLGINSRKPLLFRRTMTCSPLVTGTEFVRTGKSFRGEEQWEYWYGSSLGDYTWANPVQESAWEIKGYSTGVHCSEPGSDDSPFTPLPAFTAGAFPVTILFISSHSIFYSEIREDPIFPAHQRAQLPPEYNGPPLYYNNSTRAGVLGCVDQYQVCERASGPCWDNSNITSLLDQKRGQAIDEEQLVAHLLIFALDYSTSCGSIQFRGAEALDAQAKIAHMQSLPLANEQWRVEAEKMFQTSLARMQLNVYDFAKGTAASFEGYKNIMPDEYRGMCHMAKFPTVGWKNVSFWGMLGTFLAVGLLWLVGWTTTDQGRKVLRVVILWKDVVVPAFQVLWGHLKPLLKTVGRAIAGYIDNIFNNCF